MLGIPFIDQAIFKVFQPKTVGDASDRLSSYFTTTLCAIFAIMVSTKQYVGTPITCWNPQEFSGLWNTYTREYCFIQNTYSVSFHDHRHPAEHMRDETAINYYQWVPIILFLQAISFYLPNYVWKCFNKFNGFDIGVIVGDLCKIRSHPEPKRESSIKHISALFMENIKEYKIQNRNNRGQGISGSSLTFIYILVKVLYFTNAVVQFYFVMKLLDAHNDLWAVRALTSFWTGEQWMDSPAFPRVTFCDFAVKDLSEVRKHTVQCLLMLNMINEKIFLFLWFWFGLVVIVSVISSAFWIFRLFSFRSRMATIRGWLSYPNKESVSEELAFRFGCTVRLDGFLTLLFVELNSGSRIAAEISNDILRQMKNSNLLNLAENPSAPRESDVDVGHYPTLPIHEKPTDKLCFE